MKHFPHVFTGKENVRSLGIVQSILQIQASSIGHVHIKHQKNVLSDCGMIVSSRRARWSISITADHLGFSMSGSTSVSQEREQTHQNWAVEEWKNLAWSDESQSLASLPAFCQQIQSGGGGVMVWGMFPWYLNTCHHFQHTNAARPSQRLSTQQNPFGMCEGLSVPNKVLRHCNAYV